MSYQFLDAAGATRYAKGTGVGSVGDPDVPQVGVMSATESQTATWSASAASVAKDFTVPAYAKDISVFVANATTQTFGIELSALVTGMSATGYYYAATGVITAGDSKMFASGAGSTGASRYQQVEALSNPLNGGLLRVVCYPAASTTGTATITIIWRS